MIVVDASVVVSALGDDGPDGDRARTRLRGERLLAPHLLDVEVISAWRRLGSAGRMDDRRVSLAVGDLLELRLERLAHRPFLSRMWELRHSLTAYDATYVAMAEATGSLLLTADKRLATSSGHRCPIELLA